MSRPFDELRSLADKLERELIYLASGYVSAEFATSENPEQAVLDEPYLLFIDGRIAEPAHLVPILEKVMPTGRPLALVVTDDVGEQVLEMLIVNNRHGGLRSVVIDAPGNGAVRAAQLRETAAATGGQVLDGVAALEAATLEQLGQARRVVVDFYETTIIRPRPTSSIEAATEPIV